MTEKQIQAAVIAHWKALGQPNTLVAAIANAGAMGQPGLTKGLADLVIIGPFGTAFIELKTEKGKLSEHQEAFRDLCKSVGVQWFLARGRDEPIWILETLGVVKKQKEAA